MDYHQWVQRLRLFVLSLQQPSPADQRETFTVEIAPPLDEDEVCKVTDCRVSTLLSTTG